MSTDAAEQVHEPVENLPENENIDDKPTDEVDEACDAGLESTDAEFGDELESSSEKHSFTRAQNLKCR